MLSLGGDQSVRDIDVDPVLTAEAAFLREAVERGRAGVRRVPGRAAARARARRAGRAGCRGASQWAPIEALAAAAGDPVIGLAARRARWRCTGTRTASSRRPAPSSCCAASARRRGVPRSATAPGACSSTPRSTRRRSRAGTRSATRELSEAGVTEKEARAADAAAPARPGRAVRGAVRRLRPRRRRAHRPRVTSLDEYPHRLAIPTRWADNDVYGHVNNVEYYAFFDTVINAWLIREGGLDIHGGRR